MTKSQEPLGTKWTAYATADDVAADIDLTGRVAIVTGGASGLGLETTRVLSAQGATVVVPARRPDVAIEALKAIARVEVHRMDLNDPSSIETFANGFLESGRSLERLILSAGVMATPLIRDARGNEGQLSTNHLGHFMLARHLWPALEQAEGARVVALSSRGHQIAGIDFDDPNFNIRTYDKWRAYGQSKTANALFAVALDELGKSVGIRAFSVHPGSIVGPLARHLSDDEIVAFSALDEKGDPIIDPEADKKNFAQGAATVVWCATSSELEGRGGVYCENSDIAKIEDTANAGVRRYAIDRDLADRLWALSIRLSR